MIPHQAEEIVPNQVYYQCRLRQAQFWKQEANIT